MSLSKSEGSYRVLWFLVLDTWRVGGIVASDGHVSDIGPGSWSTPSSHCDALRTVIYSGLIGKPEGFVRQKGFPLHARSACYSA